MKGMLYTMSQFINHFDLAPFPPAPPPQKKTADVSEEGN